jgi:hypothetical protein
MSRHIGRKETWFEVSPTRFNGLHGYVQLNSFGTWDAVMVFKQRSPLQGPPKKERPWHKASKHCGEHKRARQAMMAVEDAVKKFQAEPNLDKVL